MCRGEKHVSTGSESDSLDYFPNNVPSECVLQLDTQHVTFQLLLPAQLVCCRDDMDRNVAAQTSV